MHTPYLNIQRISWMRQVPELWKQVFRKSLFLVLSSGRILNFCDTGNNIGNCDKDVLDMSKFWKFFKFLVTPLRYIHLLHPKSYSVRKNRRKCFLRFGRLKWLYSCVRQAMDKISLIFLCRLVYFQNLTSRNKKFTQFDSTDFQKYFFQKFSLENSRQPLWRNLICWSVCHCKHCSCSTSTLVSSTFSISCYFLKSVRQLAKT